MIEIKTVFIYTLSDPDTNIIKYVGKTVNIQKRFKEHSNINNTKANTKKDTWIKKLYKNNKTPKIDILDIVNENEWQYWEMYWISQLKQWGFELKNHGIGGEGGNNTPETRKKISNTVKNKYKNGYISPRVGKKHDSQQRKNISDGLKNYKPTKETIRKQSEGRYITIDIDYIRKLFVDDNKTIK